MPATGLGRKESAQELLDWVGTVCYYSLQRPYRLAVRTPGSHPGNPGSIPGRVTKELYKLAFTT